MVPRETERPTTLVIGATVPDARRLADKMGGRVIPLSPRSIRQGAARGLAHVTDILVAASQWPLPTDVAAQLEPYVIAHGARVTRIIG